MSPPRIAIAVTAALVGCAFGSASAKLPALSDEQKAKTAEAKAKAAEIAKQDAERLAKSQDRVVDNYRRAKVQKTAADVSRKH